MSFTILHVAFIAPNSRLTGPFHSVPALLRGLLDAENQVALVYTGDGIYAEPEPFLVLHHRQLGWIPTLCQCPPPFHQPDLVVFHGIYIVRQALLAWECHRRGIPYIVTPRSSLTRGAQAQKRWKKRIGNLLLFSRMIERAAAIHCLTEAESVDALAWGPPVFIVGNGVYLPSKDQCAGPGTQDHLRLLFIGRLDINHKGLDLLLEACYLARGVLQRAGARLVIHGPSIRGSALLLRDIVRSYGLDHIVSIEDPVWGTEKHRAFSSADVFVHTSRFEGHPMAVLEALSYGLPCLLTPGTNVADEVTAAGAGWQAEPTAACIAERLAEVIRERDALPAMSRRARDLVANQHTWGQVAGQVSDAYKEVIAQTSLCRRR